MSAFRALREVSNNFEHDLRQISGELFSAEIGHKFEHSIAKKVKDLALYSSKLRLLKAKPLSLTPQVLEQSNENALEDYADTAVWKVLEQVTVKSLTQAHAVTALITTPDSRLDAELVERKEAIIDQLTQYRNAESRLRQLNSLLSESESEAAACRAQWELTVGELRELKECRKSSESDCRRGPLYEKLSILVDKLELMRWLVGRLVCSRGSYDWLADPQQRLSALHLTRQYNTVELFTE